MYPEEEQAAELHFIGTQLTCLNIKVAHLLQILTTKLGLSIQYDPLNGEKITSQQRVGDEVI